MQIKLFTEEIMNPLFDIFEKMQDVTQMDIYHPEGDVFNHSLQVLKWAFRETIDTDLILAAMLHDVGKIENSLGHDSIGAEMLDDLVSAKTQWLIKNHMRIWYFILGDMKKLSKVKELAEHPWLPELVFLARWDKKGRNPNALINYDRQGIMDILNKCIELKFERYESV